MQPHDPPITGPKPPAKNATLRYAVSLTLLLVVVGGIAWLVQYLPGKQKKDAPPPPPSAKKMVEFPTHIAIWAPVKESSEKKSDKDGPTSYPFKDCEVGDDGYYDFLFRNVAGEDIEIISFSSTCDCTSVKAASLPTAEVERLLKFREGKPGEKLSYAGGKDDPAGLTEIFADNKKDDDNVPKAGLRIKADEGGVVRLVWIAKKSAGQDLNVSPLVWFRAASDPGRRDRVPLMAQVKVMPPVQFLPPRTTTGVLTPGTTGRAEFKAWSSTRPEFKLDLDPGDPLISVQMRPFSPAEGESLEKQLMDAKIGTRVLAGYHVTVTVHENKSGTQLEQGVFFRKLPVSLDGRPTDLFGPEIIGIVKGDIQVGGADDHGKIHFPSFETKYGASRVVQLSADAKIELKTHLVHPTWAEVKLKCITKDNPVDGKHIWELEVTVPPETRDARSFRVEDAVVLRIVGKKDRFVRIPIEGHISGGR